MLPTSYVYNTGSYHFAQPVCPFVALCSIPLVPIITLPTTMSPSAAALPALSQGTNYTGPIVAFDEIAQRQQWDGPSGVTVRLPHNSSSRKRLRVVATNADGSDGVVWETVDPLKCTIMAAFADVELTRLPANLTTVSGGGGIGGGGGGGDMRSSEVSQSAVCMLAFAPNLLRPTDQRIQLTVVLVPDREVGPSERTNKLQTQTFHKRFA